MRTAKLLLLLLLLSAKWACAQTNTELLSFYDWKGRPVKLRTDTDKILVISNNFTCNECYKELDAFFVKLLSLKKDLVFISLTSESAVEKRTMIKKYKKTYRAFQNYLFIHISDPYTFIPKAPQNSVYTHFQVEKTPFLILVRSGQLYPYDYDAIFTSAGIIDRHLRDEIKSMRKRPKTKDRVQIN